MRMRSIIAVLLLLIVTVPVALGTALDDYVAAPDSNYSYRVVKTIEVPGCTGYVLEMTSQAWRSEKEVDRTVWKHWLTIIKPEKVASDIALLWITGGSNDRPAPERPEQMLVAIAQNSGSVIAEVRMVPNQPLSFPDGGQPRYEDGIIAYTFDKYIRTGDGTWPLLLPMVKSAVRAMDTIQSHIASATEGKLKINKFVVSGGSKRGWTTWLTAAVDKRIIAIAPVVIDVLNMAEQMKHHYAAYGFYSKAIEDYQDTNIFARLDTPEGKALREFIDPYAYRNRYTMPKYLINSSGDQFFLCDSAQFYFGDLPGEKYLRYVPNTDHGLGGSDADKSLLVFYASILKNLPRPKFTWTIQNDRIIVKLQSGTLQQVNLWQATNPKARDFRLQTIGAVWNGSPLPQDKNGAYIAEVPEPKEGWTAFFVEMIYDSGTPLPYKFTTQVHVVPQKLPFAKN